MSRLALAQPAVREKIPAKIMISGGEGAGKTETALRMAQVFTGGVGDVLFIDTERRKALLYADRFTFVHVPWDPPFDPDELAADVLAGGDQYPVIVVDSVYHFWSEEGGVRDIADRSAPGNNKFGGWKDARPAHRRMVNAILDSRAHVILCCRAKVDYVQETDPATGKLKVRSLGMQPMTDDFFPSEVDIHVRMDAEDHTLHAVKSRIEPIPQGAVYSGDEAEGLAKTYAEWCQGGVLLAPPEVVAEIEARMGALSDQDHRVESKKRFVTELARPRFLRETQVAAAFALVEQFEAEQAQATASVAPPAARTAKTDDRATGQDAANDVAPIGSVAEPADPPVPPDPEQLAAWLRVYERLAKPDLLGDEGWAEFQAWGKAEKKRSKARTKAELVEVVDKARAIYSKVHGGPHGWDPDELESVAAKILEMEGATDQRPFEEFEAFTFERLADALAPETWTTDQREKFLPWLMLGATPVEEKGAADEQRPAA